MHNRLEKRLLPQRQPIFTTSRPVSRSSPFKQLRGLSGLKPLLRIHSPRVHTASRGGGAGRPGEGFRSGERAQRPDIPGGEFTWDHVVQTLDVLLGHAALRAHLVDEADDEAHHRVGRVAALRVLVAALRVETLRHAARHAGKNETTTPSPQRFRMLGIANVYF